MRSQFFLALLQKLVHYTIMHISSISNVTNYIENKKLHVVGSTFCIQNM